MANGVSCWRLATIARFLLVSAMLAGASDASVAADPVKHIAVYVEPFYRAASTPDGIPQVRTGKPFAEQLASNRLSDIQAVRDAILAKPGHVTPMTLMVLAIRFYDLGQRDEAVFWFYAAKDRYFTLLQVADGAPQLQESAAAMSSFNFLVGPYINGYAFCDLAVQSAQRTRALAWVEANPYEVIFMERLPVRAADRKAALAEAVAAARASLDKERAYLADPANVAKLKADRLSNGMDGMYCWR